MSGLDRTSHETLTGFVAVRLSERELGNVGRGNPTFGRVNETGRLKQDADVLDLS